MELFEGAWLVVALLLMTLASAVAQDVPERILYDFPEGFDVGRLRARDTRVERVVWDGEGALRLHTGHAQPWPGIDLPAPFGPWDLTPFEYVALEARNVGQNAVTVCLRVDNMGADGVNNCLTGRLTLQPGETGTLKVPLSRQAPGTEKIRLFGMRGLPWAMSAGKTINPAEIVNLVVFVPQPQADHIFEIRRVRAAGRYQLPPEAALTPEAFFPFIDEFGQYIHRDWPGKIHRLEDFAARRQQEEADLQAHPGPADWDEYGGWKNGPQLEATGFFRVVKYEGRWWLVDPIGHLFWSHGVDCVTPYEGSTVLDEREHWFRNLPPPEGEFKACYGRAGRVVYGYYKGRQQLRTFDFGRANLIRKYGPDFLTAFAELSQRRLRSWGLNTIANWSDPAIYLLRRTPYVVTIGYSAPLLEGSEGYWRKFPDPFDGRFAEAVRQAMARQAGVTAGDPWCLGYFVDNELSWGDDTALALWTLQSPPTQAAKQALVADLQAKYGEIGRLNEAWGTAYASWEALLEARTAPDKRRAAADLQAFTSRMAEQYFKTIQEAIKAVAPHQLYLGCRFAWVNDRAALAAAKYCDVVSYNLYRPTVADFKPAGGADVPLIIGEFHFGALDRGMFHTGLVPVANQEARAEAYRRYVEGALRNPFFVGTAWFKYMDEATTGRPLDEENYQIGLVDICDTPYWETIAAVRDIGYRLYEIRAGKP